MMEKVLFDNLITHGGVFHADDVFSTAFMFICREAKLAGTDTITDELAEVLRYKLSTKLRVYHNLKEMSPSSKLTFDVYRVNSLPDGTIFDESDNPNICFDIGNGMFDHHGEIKESRDAEGLKPYAAFGKLFREFSSVFLTSEEATKFDNDLVSIIDICDNGGYSNPLSASIRSMNTNWTTNGDVTKADNAFKNAVKVAFEILIGNFIQISGKRQAYSYCMSEYVKHIKDDPELKEKKTLVLDMYAPYSEFCFDLGLRSVIYPSLRGGYNLSVPIKYPSNFEPWLLRKDLWGKTTEELRKITGIETITFVHKTGFLAACDTMEDCIKLTNFIVENDDLSENKQDDE